jgi:hypothetical protein
MTFTDLEYVLMLAVAVLLWRGAVLSSMADKLGTRANTYATFLVAIGKKKGRVVPSDESSTGFKFEEIK